jgi:hypothetical protein
MSAPSSTGHAPVPWPACPTRSDPERRVTARRTAGLEGPESCRAMFPQHLRIPSREREGRGSSMGSQATAPVHDPRDLRRLEPDWFTIDMADGTENLWFYWPMLGTGVIVAITSVVLVGVGGLLGADWGHGKIDRRATASVGFDRGTVARLEVAAYCTTWVVRRRPTPCGTSWIPTRRARNCGGRPGSATSTPTRSRQCC